MKITKEQFDKLYDDNITKKEYDSIIDLINKRFTEICNIFLKKKSHSFFDYGNMDWEGGDGFFDPKAYKEEIAIAGEWIDHPVGYEYSFPTRWLWEENWQEEMKINVESYKQLLAKEKEKAKAKKEEKKQKLTLLKQSIKSKLTPEEYKIIKFK